MPDATLLRAAPIVAADTATRTLTVQLLRWDDPRTVVDPGRPPYTEVWARGSLASLDRLYVVDRHMGELIGRMDTPYDGGPGPHSQVHIAHTRAGDDLLALVDAGVVDQVSIEALADPTGEVWSPDHRTVTRTRGTLAGVAFTFHPAHDAPILARTTGGPMPTTTDPAPAGAPPAPPTTPADPLADILRSLQALDGAPDPAAGASGAPAGPAVAGTPTTPTPGAPSPAPGPGSTAEQLARAIDARVAAAAPSVDAMQAELVTLRRGVLGLVEVERSRRAGPTYRYGSWGEVLRAGAAGELTDADYAALNRAIVDITTGDIPGLIPRPVVAQILDVIQQNQQLANAAGTVPLPDSGMTIDFPRITARPSVAIQATEKTDVASAKSHVERDSVPVVTLAGGEDVSIQAILRSSPSYLQLVGELYLEAMATATDAYAWSIYEPEVPATHEVSIGATVPGWIPGLFGLAGLILDEARVLPDRMVLSTDLWVKVGGAVDAEGRPIFTNRSPQNPGGTASLTSTEGEVRDLAWVVDPNLPADTGLMFAASCFRSALGPVSTLTSDVPTKLGRDYAVYRFGAFLVTDANGLGVFHTAPVVPLTARGAKSTK